MTGPVLPRDAQGWRIPRKHTLSWYIYRLAKKGWGPTRIAQACGVTYNSVAVLLWKIRHPEKSNAQSRLGSS